MNIDEIEPLKWEVTDRRADISNEHKRSEKLSNQPSRPLTETEALALIGDLQTGIDRELSRRHGNK